MSQTTMDRTAGNGRTGTNLPAKAEGRVTLRELLEKRRDVIADVLPRHLTPERLIKLAAVAVGRDPKLGRATGLSVVNAVVKAAELGLDCSGTLGSAYLVPFDVNKKDEHGNWHKELEAQLIIGYRGLIDLARRSGQIASIEARVVWANDEFDFEYGLEPRLTHKPAIDKDPGALRLVYGIAKLKDGAVQVEVMTKAEIDKIKARSQSARSEKSPWHTDYPEMARKTVVKRLCKYLPLSVEIQEIIAADNHADPIDLVEGTLVPPSSTDRLNARLTNRPTSEGQTFVPDTGAAENVAAQDAAVEGEVVNQGTGEVTAPEPDTSGADAEPVDTSGPYGHLSGRELNDGADATTAAKPAAKADPKAEWQAFYAELEQAAKKHGMDPDQFDRGVERFLVGQKLKGKPERATAAHRAVLMAAVRERRGYFAAPTAE